MRVRRRDARVAEQIADGVEVFAETQYSKRTGQGRLDGNPGTFGTVAYPDGWRVPASNPLARG